MGRQALCLRENSTEELVDFLFIAIGLFDPVSSTHDDDGGQCREAE